MHLAPHIAEGLTPANAVLSAAAALNLLRKSWDEIGDSSSAAFVAFGAETRAQENQERNSQQPGILSFSSLAVKTRH